MQPVEVEVKGGLLRQSEGVCTGEGASGLSRFGDGSLETTGVSNTSSTAATKSSLVYPAQDEKESSSASIGSTNTGPGL